MYYTTEEIDELKFEIPVKLWDLLLNEYDEVLLYPANRILRERDSDRNLTFAKSPEESLIDELPYLRDSITTFAFKGNVVYNKDVIVKMQVNGKHLKV